MLHDLKSSNGDMFVFVFDFDSDAIRMRFILAFPDMQSTLSD